MSAGRVLYIFKLPECQILFPTGCTRWYFHQLSIQASSPHQHSSGFWTHASLIDEKTISQYCLMHYPDWDWASFVQNHQLIVSYWMLSIQIPFPVGGNSQNRAVQLTTDAERGRMCIITFPVPRKPGHKHKPELPAKTLNLEEIVQRCESWGGCRSMLGWWAFSERVTSV